MNHSGRNSEEEPTSTTRSMKGELSSVISWIRLISFLCTSMITWGTISIFPVLFVAFLERFQQSRSLTSLIGSLQAGLFYMLTVIPGYLIPRYGFRINVVIGCSLMALGFISTIFVTDIYYLYVTIGLFTSLGASFLLTAADSAPLVVFNEWRSLAAIASGTAASIGFAVMPLVVNCLLETYGLQGALLLLAGIVLQCNVFGMWFPVKYTLHDQHLDEHNFNNKDQENTDDETKPKNKYLTIVKSPTFWCMTAAQLALSFLSDNCRVFLLDRAIDQGIPKFEAVLCISLWGIFGAVSRLFVQMPVLNKNPIRKQVFFIFLTFCWSFITLLSVVLKTFLGFLVYCIFGGAFHGICTVLWYLILADTMQHELLVTALSLQLFIVSPFVILSVPFSGMIYDHLNSYNTPYIINGSFGLFWSICECFIPYFEKKKKRKKDFRL